MKDTIRFSRRAGFTLVELMVVIAFMALLASFSVAFLPGVGKAKQLTMSGNMTVDLINQARQNAMAHRALTALVLVTDPASPDLCGRLFVVEEYDPTANAWTQVSRWMFLPRGVVVDPNTTATTGTFASPATRPSLTASISPLTYAGKSLAALAYQVFLPDGRLLTSGVSSPVSPQLRLIEGVRDGTQLAATGPGGNLPPNYYDITINLYTGIPQADRP